MSISTGDVGYEAQLVQALSAFFGTIERSKASSPGMTPVIRRLSAVVETLFESFPEVDILFRNDQLMVNRQSFSDQASLALIDFLRRRQIGRLHFRFPLADDEWRMVALVFRRTRRLSFHDMSTSLMDRGLLSLRVEKLGSVALMRRHLQHRDAFIQRLYFDAIATAATLLRRARQGGLIALKNVKRPVQRIIDLLVDGDLSDRAHLFALTRIKNWGGYTPNHCVNVTILAISFGTEIGLPRELLYEIGLSALLHGLGKCFIPQAIQQKTGSLTLRDWRSVEVAVMHSMPLMTRFEAVDETIIKIFSTIWDLRARRHDSNSVLGKHLGVYAQLISLAESYDALTTTRPFRLTPMTHEQALTTVAKGKTRAIDTVLLGRFLDSMAFKVWGHLMLLTDKRLGVVLPPMLEDQSPVGRFHVLRDANLERTDIIEDIPIDELEDLYDHTVNPIELNLGREQLASILALGRA